MKFIRFDDERGNIIEFCCAEAERLYNQHDIEYIRGMGKFFIALRPKKDNPFVQYLEELKYCLFCSKKVWT